MGMCSKKIDPTILSIDFGMKSNLILDQKRIISEKCREIELLQIKLSLEKDHTKKVKLQNKINADNLLARRYVKDYLKMEKQQKKRLKGDESEDEDVFELKQRDLESLQELE